MNDGCLACEEMNEALTEAAQSLGMDPDGVDDKSVLREITKIAGVKTELQQFIAMLERSWIGHGTRLDSDGGTGVQVETTEGNDDIEFGFNAEGQLIAVIVCCD